MIFRFFLSSFSKKENMENARLLLIEKLKESIAAPAFVADTRYTLKLQACHLVNIIDQKSITDL